MSVSVVPMHRPGMTRREFGALLLAAAATRALPAGAAPGVAAVTRDTRRIDICVTPDGFGDVAPADIAAVANSAAGEIWNHCLNTHFETAGIKIYHRNDVPMTDFEHTDDGRISIGLASEGTRWAQMAYQFGHEFCHALAGHSNDWRRLLHPSIPNMWLEESLCETASLYSLRAMSCTWQTSPPYSNWRDYAVHLGRYAWDRLSDPKHQLREGQTFKQWFKENEPALRGNPVLRDKNTIVAANLLPLFESSPEGWEAVTALRLGDHFPGKPLDRHLQQWQENVSPPLRPFVSRVQEIFGLT